MINLTTLLNKSDFTKPNGDVVVDLIRRAVAYLNIRVNGGKSYVVTDETCMRPDLISNQFYQRTDFADLLLKYNGYSNPFSVNVGDILRIPDGETIIAFSKQPALAQFKPRKDRKSTRLNSSHVSESRMPSSA